MFTVCVHNRKIFKIVAFDFFFKVAFILTRNIKDYKNENELATQSNIKKNIEIKNEPTTASFFMEKKEQNMLMWCALNI